MTERALALHRRAEQWMGWAELARWRSRPELARWCWRRAARAERAALATLQAAHPERVATIRILACSLTHLEEEAER